MNEDLRINGERLWESLMLMAAVGERDGGCNRVALTDEDKEGQDLFISWAEDAGCRVGRDEIGNLFAERPGAESGRAQVLIGSHLDTVPRGGKFDGPYGVLTGLEIVRTLNERGVVTRAPLVVVSWSNEEGARFPQPMTGSAVFSGLLTLEEALAQPAHDGPTFGDELARLGLRGDEVIGSRTVGAYFEAHIEQGPTLESTGSVIGVVTRGQGVRALEVTLMGVESHSGTTSMDARRDALVGAARVVELANRLGGDVEGAKLTVGHLKVEPNARAVIPGRVTLVVDMRHRDATVLDEIEASVRAGVERIAAESFLAVESSMVLSFGPTLFDESCNRYVRDAAAWLNHPAMELVSGAGHDAMYVSTVAPTALMFIPCREGVSHNPAEYASPEHVAAGADVVLHAALPCAGVL